MVPEGANAPSGFPFATGEISYVKEAKPLFNPLLIPTTWKEMGKTPLLPTLLLP